MFRVSGRSTDAIPCNDDLFIVAPLHHSAGIIFNTREVLGFTLGKRIPTRLSVGIIFNTRVIESVHFYPLYIPFAPSTTKPSPTTTRVSFLIPVSLWGLLLRVELTTIARVLFLIPVRFGVSPWGSWRYQQGLRLQLLAMTIKGEGKVLKMGAPPPLSSPPCRRCRRHSRRGSAAPRTTTQHSRSQHFALCYLCERSTP